MSIRFDEETFCQLEAACERYAAAETDWKARAEKAEAKLQAVMQWKVDNDRKIDENASLDLYALLTE